MGQGFALFAASPAEVIRACAREAEALSYTSFWVNHPGSFDGLAALALAAKETRRIDLGIGVIPYYGLASGFLSGKYRSEADLAQSPRGAG